MMTGQEDIRELRTRAILLSTGQDLDALEAEEKKTKDAVSMLEDLLANARERNNHAYHKAARFRNHLRSQARSAMCPSCGAYDDRDVIGHGPPGTGPDELYCWKCRHTWKPGSIDDVERELILKILREHGELA